MMKKQKNIIFIPGQTRSSKNSKIWTGEFLIDSELVQNYRKATKEFWSDESLKSAFKELTKGKSKPYILGFHFVHKDKRRRDFHNFVQLPLDLMVEHGWLEDDNDNIVYAVPLLLNGNFKTHDKENPGVWITMTTLPKEGSYTMIRKTK